MPHHTYTKLEFFEPLICSSYIDTNKTGILMRLKMAKVIKWIRNIKTMEFYFDEKREFTII